jgi:hypothetical protein
MSLANHLALVCRESDLDARTIDKLRVSAIAVSACHASRFLNADMSVRDEGPTLAKRFLTCNNLPWAHASGAIW